MFWFWEEEVVILLEKVNRVSKERIGDQEVVIIGERTQIEEKHVT